MNDRYFARNGPREFTYAEHLSFRERAGRMGRDRRGRLRYLVPHCVETNKPLIGFPEQ
jgi:hypothetical protein